MEYSIGEDTAQMTVKNFLLSHLHLSHAQVTALKKLPLGILVNGAHVTVRYVLQPQDVLSLATEDREASETIVPTPLPLCVLYEDDSLIVLNKPPFMPTHPSHGHYTDTLANGLAYLFETRGIPFVFRACSRLDRDTSGVVTIAKNRAAAYSMHCAHLAGTIQKEYLAVLNGTLTPAVGEISGCIRRKEESVITRTVTENDGAPALTRYRVLAYGCDRAGHPLTLVSAEPVTGRTHQLRVHFASRGTPILGDFLYGSQNADAQKDTVCGKPSEEGVSPDICRQALHCCRTSFFHPVSMRRMTVTAAPPDDFCALYALFNACVI